MVQSTQLDGSPTDDDEIQELLSNSLLRLKFQDRNEIREEVHGACCLAPEENPGFIDHSLDRMNQELKAILSASREDHAYQQARYLPNTFVNDREFRLKFLRCELFDPIKAADRMIVHLDYILLLFGPRGLREPLKADFFVKEEAAALRQGYIQLLPFRDRSGRRVLTFLPGILTYSPRLRVKLWFYFFHVASEDIESQRRGVVCVCWSTTDLFDSGEPFELRIPGTAGNEGVVLENGRGMENACISRFISFHMCYPDTPIFRFVKHFYVIAMGEKWRSRMVFHSGTPLEMQYKMMGYGIPVSYIPATDTGAVKVKNHSQWLRLRKQIEKDPIAYSNVCECPGLNDVLFRRAGSCMAHPGNSRFKNLLECQKEKHTKSNQTEKRDIAWSIVEEVENNGGRFFSWCIRQTCWVQMTDRSDIRQKVAMSIRDFNRQSKAVENHQSTKSSTSVFECQDGNSRKRKNVDDLFSPCTNMFRAKPLHTPSANISDSDISA